MQSFIVFCFKNPLYSFLTICFLMNIWLFLHLLRTHLEERQELLIFVNTILSCIYLSFVNLILPNVGLEVLIIYAMEGISAVLWLLIKIIRFIKKKKKARIIIRKNRKRLLLVFYIFPIVFYTILLASDLAIIYHATPGRLIKCKEGEWMNTTYTYYALTDHCIQKLRTGIGHVLEDNSDYTRVKEKTYEIILKEHTQNIDKQDKENVEEIVEDMREKKIDSESIDIFAYNGYYLVYTDSSNEYTIYYGAKYLGKVGMSVEEMWEMK